MQNGSRSGDDPCTRPQPQTLRRISTTRSWLSAGGVEAMKSFVAERPADTPASFVILQHLAPDHESQLADILSRSSKLPVQEADETMSVASGHIYVLTPDRYLTIVDHGLFVEPPTQPRGSRMPIDHFMRTLAETAGARSVGVILSGTGNDGTAGLQTIKGVGGVALAQDPQTALYDGMPQSPGRTPHGQRLTGRIRISE